MSDPHADERPHAAGPELSWSESYWFELYDTESGLAGVARLDVRPNEGTAEAALSFFIPDGGFITARHVAPRGDAATPLEVEGVRFAMLEPQRKWRLTYDGPAHSLDSVADTGKREAWLKSRLERLIVELDVQTSHPAAPSPNGFAQAARFTGEVWISGDRYELQACGMRGKSWGAATVPRARQRFALAFGDERALLVEHAVFDDGGEELHGWIRRDGSVRRVRGMEQRTETGPGSLLPKAFRLALHDEQLVRHEVAGELLHTAPLPGFRGGRDDLLYLGVARATWDGAVGFGIVEDLHQLDADGRPVEPVR